MSVDFGTQLISSARSWCTLEQIETAKSEFRESSLMRCAISSAVSRDCFGSRFIPPSLFKAQSLFDALWSGSINERAGNGFVK